jgi:hypothetical protein
VPERFVDRPSGADSEGPLIFVRDSFHAPAIRAVGGEAVRLLLCFLTRRGLFVSPWLSPSGPCFICFERRWLANLALWEHSAQQERELQALESRSPGIRSFPVPATAAFLACERLLDRLDGSRPETAHYADLVSCEVTAGLLLPVPFCPGCRQRPHPPGQRYLTGLSALAERFAP